ncbi:hypothetical protein EMIHUDRAFT_313952 [Emiliania huxleyi CCMP1516]|uniref:Anthranilate synthase component 2 n=4 Tax=Emiliania huxleyi TaxID=2903 RepID=A0A0D3KD29_EMIH1|nr:hypothetical protein EMIHUDRAFT_313952 [Emiliania huxleyi CCMP1516]EOD33664.1 hypothetical protein EMIHUDRAFT_313952 [Emiliania huxleyi CCMP1516]|eukprot:XP_005786093.1 hypothetical protein EMIHUDRAFT_313952 [Emiliania huxleyi CCMP1516]
MCYAASFDALPPSPLRVLLIDNFDSYTQNLYHALAQSGCEVLVVKNNQFASWDALCSALPPFAAVVISPGPGSPANAADFGVCSEAYDAGLPLFGVCLGHQGLALSVGATVGLASEPMHGRLSDVTHAGCELFAGLPRSFRAVRYHSLVVEAASVPSCLEVTAWTASGEVMALRHRSLPQYGVQFHPESICTEYGEALVANFARLAARSAARRAPMASPRLTPPLSPASLSPDSLSPSRAGTPDASDAPPVPRRLGAPPPAARRLLVSEVGGGRFLDSAAVFEALFGALPVAYWLDSSCCSSSGDTPTGEPARARYSYMGAFGGPHSSLLRCGAGGGISLVGRDGADESLSGGSLLQAMRERLVPWEGAESELPPFRGGWVGFFSYEAWRRALWLFSDRYLAFDHAARRVVAVCLCDPGREGKEQSAQQWLWETAAALQQRGLSESDAAGGGATARLPPGGAAAACQPLHGGAAAGFESARSRDEYTANIERIFELLREGESYEVCLTTQFRAPPPRAAPPPSPLALHLALRRVNPAPVCCSSPERFLRIGADGSVESKPIKGSRRDARADDASRADGRARRRQCRDPAHFAEGAFAHTRARLDRAENLMIVDLVRNDLGRICRVGSVRVPKLMAIETYASVHQLVSTVTGDLEDGTDALDAAACAFPPGSMTGAPKTRTLQIIHELERGVPRGVYSGSLGFFSIDGASDLNVVIRTAVVSAEGVSLGAGGAIVTQSSPEDEWEEVLVKARPVIRAVECWLRPGDEAC